MAAAVLQRLMPFMNQTRTRTNARLNLTASDGGKPLRGNNTMAEEGNTEDGAADVSEDEIVQVGQEEPDEYVASDSEAEAPVEASSSKNRPSNRRAPRRNHQAQSEIVAESDGSVAAESSDSSDDDNGGPEEWEAESEADKDADANAVDPNSCIYCGETEDNDPCEEYEEYLACSNCGDNAHRQCARDSGSLKADEDAITWRCDLCAENNLEESTKEDDVAERRRSAAQKLTRDLLPAHRGSIKPGSHSVFNTLILDDDPMDGSRSLRKRKSSNDLDDRQEPARKRERRRTNEPAKNEEAVFGDDAPNGLTAVDTEDTSAVRARPARARGQRRTGGYLAMVIQSTEDSLIMSFKIDHSKLASEKRKQKRRDREKARRAQAIQMISEEETSHYPALQTSSFTHFYAFNENKEGEEVKSKPYGGILSEQEADTTKTFPQAADRKRFEDVRLKAEADWRDKLRQAAANESTRPSQKVSGPPSKIKCINFGSHEIDTWHAAPYPEEYSRNKVLYICEFCLKYMNSDYVAWRHKLKCPAKHPPGDEIYRDGQFSFFEVDGRKNPVYCQNLCLLAKLFLGSKTLYYDVEPFLFYIMTENDEYGCHFVGYFSKEKRPSSQNNVSCILVLPIHQRRGFGHMLIDFSYMLTKVEQKTGSPEKPLSDMGLVSYRSYWRLVLCTELLSRKEAISITEISERTGMTADDIVCALEGLRALVRDPLTKTYALRLDFPFFRQYIENHERKGYAKLNPDSLIWVPYVMGRDNMHYEHAPPLHTVAQRDEDADASDEAQLAASGVSERDYAKSTKEITDGQSVVNGDDGDMTPFPALSAEQQLSLTNQSRHSPLRKASSASTTLVNGSDRSDDMAPIPATRFEVYPPLPFARKRGRPPGSRTRARGSPYTRVRHDSMGGASPSNTHGPSSLRRSRTALDFENSIGDANADSHDEEMDEASVQVEGEEEEEEVDADNDPDAKLEADVDAEGDAESGSEVEGADGSEEDSDADEIGEDIDAEGSPDSDA